MKQYVAMKNTPVHPHHSFGNSFHHQPHHYPSLHSSLRNSYNWYPAPYYVLQPEVVVEEPTRQTPQPTPAQPEVVVVREQPTNIAIVLPLIFIIIILGATALSAKFG